MRKLSNLQNETSLLQNRFPIMISACLIGVHCRYDGGHSICHDLVDFSPSISFIPFCPEHLGGLPTPRPPARIVRGAGRDVIAGEAKLINSLNQDITEEFRKGAMESLRLARLAGTKIAIMKDKSPSCGLSTPYCEKPTGIGMGVTAALFRSQGIKIFELGPNDSFPTQDFLILLE